MTARRWLVIALAIVGLWIVITHLTELDSLYRTLRTGQWQWIAAAAAAQAAYFLAFAVLFAAGMGLVGVAAGARDMLPLLFVSTFASLVVPTSGQAVFIDYAGRTGQSRPRATAGLLLVRSADYTAFAIVTAIGMAYLLAHHDLARYEVVGAIALLAVVVGQMLLLAIGLWQPAALRRALAGAQHLVLLAGRPFGRAPATAAGWADRAGGEYGEAAAAVRHGRPVVVRALLLALLLQMLDLACLFALFEAFHVRVEPGVLVAGFAFGILFWMVPITPQGVGVVEGMMVLVYSSLGVPTATATLVALAFRGLGLWLPVLAGFVLLRRLGEGVAPPGGDG